jgi:hypothetical protein
MRQEGQSASTSNPYDYVGRLHNEFLGLLERTARDLDQSKGARDVDANDLLASFLEEREIEARDTRPDVSWSVFADEIPRVDRLLKEGTISEVQHRYLREVEEAVDALGPDLDASPPVRALSDIERRVAGDESLDETDKALLLSTASVARHSTEYWAREANDPSSIWFDPEDPAVSSGGTTTIAKGVVSSDLVGAAVGAAAGAAGGTPATVAGGAALGAIKASAGEAIKKGVKKLWGKIKSLF